MIGVVLLSGNDEIWDAPVVPKRTRVYCEDALKVALPLATEVPVEPVSKEVMEVFPEGTEL